MFLLLLAGCGKKGAPVAPGPANMITYPHSYPSALKAPGRIAEDASSAETAQVPQGDEAARWNMAIRLAFE